MDTHKQHKAAFQVENMSKQLHNDLAIPIRVFMTNKKTVVVLLANAKMLRNKIGIFREGVSGFTYAFEANDGLDAEGAPSIEPSQGVSPYPYLDNQVIGQDSVEAIQRRLLADPR